MTLFCVFVQFFGLFLAVQEAVTPEVASEAPEVTATVPETATAPASPAVEGAKDAEKKPTSAAKDAKEEPPQAWMQFLPFAAIGLFFYFILLRPQQAEQRRRKELLTALKKNDKVVTTGGMIGTIADISSDGTRITLKVDDNTRIKFLRSAIQEPLKDGSESNGSSST